MEENNLNHKLDFNDIPEENNTDVFANFKEKLEKVQTSLVCILLSLS